jgi:hypothetical protein
MKPREIHGILGGILKLRLSNRTKHQSYELWLEGEKLHLPRLVTVSFGDSDDISPKVIRGCADDLGLTKSEFLEVGRKRIGRGLVLLALAVMCQEAKAKFGLTKEAGWNEPHALDDTIYLLLKEASISSDLRIYQEEKRLLVRLRGKPFDHSGVGAEIQKKIGILLKLISEMEGAN